MPQGPANIRASLNSKCPPANGPSQVSQHYEQYFLLTVPVICKSEVSCLSLLQTSILLFLQSREEEHSETAACCTSSPGSPGTPHSRAQSASQSVAETVAPSCGQTKTSRTTPASTQRGQLTFCTNIVLVLCHYSPFEHILSEIHLDTNALLHGTINTDVGLSLYYWADGRICKL